MQRKKFLSFVIVCMFTLGFTTPALGVSLNSTCSEKDWLKGTVKSFGKTKAQCVAGPLDYYWIALKDISGDARAAGPNESKRRLDQSGPSTQAKSSKTAQLTRVPNIMGLRTSAAQSALQSYGLRFSHVYRPAGGQAGANCAMTNGGVVIGMSIRPGTVVPIYTTLTFATDC